MIVLVDLMDLTIIERLKLIHMLWIYGNSATGLHVGAALAATKL